MVQVVLISISAFSLAFHAMEQLLAGARTAAAADGIGVSLVAMAATLARSGSTLWGQAPVTLASVLAARTSIASARSAPGIRR